MCYNSGADDEKEKNFAFDDKGWNIQEEDSEELMEKFMETVED